MKTLQHIRMEIHDGDGYTSCDFNFHMGLCGGFIVCCGFLIAFLGWPK